MAPRRPAAARSPRQQLAKAYRDREPGRASLCEGPTLARSGRPPDRGVADLALMGKQARECARHCALVMEFCGAQAAPQQRSQGLPAPPRTAFRIERVSSRRPSSSGMMPLGRCRRPASTGDAAWSRRCSPIRAARATSSGGIPLRRATIRGLRSERIAPEDRGSSGIPRSW
jgi:hypothetical protein